jgi:hypothetical protein
MYGAGDGRKSHTRDVLDSASITNESHNLSERLQHPAHERQNSSSLLGKGLREEHLLGSFA